MVAPNSQHTLCVTDNVNRHLLKRMKKNICKTNDFSLLDSCQPYIIEKYKDSNCFKTEAVIQRCCGKKVFLKNLKNLQENPCARV